MDVIPPSIKKKCQTYGFFQSDEILLRTMMEIMPTKDIARLSLANDLQSKPTKVPSTASGLAAWLEDYHARLSMAAEMGSAIEPRIITSVLYTAMENVMVQDNILKQIWLTYLSKPEIRNPSNLHDILMYIKVMLGEVRVRAQEETIQGHIQGQVSHAMQRSVNLPIAAGMERVVKKPCPRFHTDCGGPAGRNCPLDHPQDCPGRCFICGSTKHVSKDCTRLRLKPTYKGKEVHIQ